MVVGIASTWFCKLEYSFVNLLLEDTTMKSYFGLKRPEKCMNESFMLSNSDESVPLLLHILLSLRTEC